MNKRIDLDGKEVLVLGQSDLDNSISMSDLDYAVSEDNIRGGIGHSVFENDYITKSKYMVGAFSVSNSIRNLIHELELAQMITKTNELQVQACDYYTSTEDVLKGIADINSYILDRDTQITSIKSQLKHCNNPLQKLNMEREMNKLIRERKETKCET